MPTKTQNVQLQIMLRHGEPRVVRGASPAAIAAIIAAALGIPGGVAIGIGVILCATGRPGRILRLVFQHSTGVYLRRSGRGRQGPSKQPSVLTVTSRLDTLVAPNPPGANAG